MEVAELGASHPGRVLSYAVLRAPATALARMTHNEPFLAPCFLYFAPRVVLHSVHHCCLLAGIAPACIACFRGFPA